MQKVILNREQKVAQADGMAEKFRTWNYDNSMGGSVKSGQFTERFLDYTISIT